MPGNSLLIGVSCILVLVLLAVRAVLLLGQHRRGDEGGGDGNGGCGGQGGNARHHRRSEASHLAMAVGMALMFLPVPAARPALAGLFGAIVLVAAAVWVADQVRSVGSRGRAGHRPPGHRLEPHHVIVGSAMAVMALRSRTAAAGMAAMPGMAIGSGGPGVLSLTFFGYVWLSVLVLGGGLARAFLAETSADIGPGSATGSGPRGLGALLGAPSTVYACELAMTVVMGLMLLS